MVAVALAQLAGRLRSGVKPEAYERWVRETNADAIRRWAVDYQEALHPYSAGGAYVNMMMDEGQDRVRASYRDNYTRLAQIKATYDPDGLRRMGMVGVRPDLEQAKSWYTRAAELGPPEASQRLAALAALGR